MFSTGLWSEWRRPPSHLAGRKMVLQTSKFQLQPRPVMLMSTNRINILGLVLEDLRAQREGFLAAGFWVLLVYRFGHARFAIRSKWLRLPWTIVYRILFKVVEIVFGVTLPASATVGRRLQFATPSHNVRLAPSSS